MPRIFKRFRGPFLFLMLFAVSARVFTGAPEAQINFTSLIVDTHVVTDDSVNQQALLDHSEFKSAENASSIPEKHRTYATYKKYLTPDKSFAVQVAVSRGQSSRHEQVGYLATAHIHNAIYLPLSNSPPVGVSARSLTHTPTTDTSVVLENYFGEIEIDNSAGGLGSFQL
jgi:hypothetical protein